MVLFSLSHCLKTQTASQRLRMRQFVEKYGQAISLSSYLCVSNHCVCSLFVIVAIPIIDEHTHTQTFRVQWITIVAISLCALECVRIQ